MMISFGQFNPASHATPRFVGFEQRPTLQDRIHTVAFVIDASTIDVLSTSVLRQMKEIQSLIVERGKCPSKEIKWFSFEYFQQNPTILF